MSIASILGTTFRPGSAKESGGPVYRIERKEWGFHLTFEAFVPKAMMEAWVEESIPALDDVPPKFWVFVDLSRMAPVTQDTREVMIRGQQLYQDAGMVRSAVVVDSVATVMQFRRIAEESGIYQWERYFDAQDPDHETSAMRWLRDAHDPEGADTP